MTTHTIHPGGLDIALLQSAVDGGARWQIAESARAGIAASVRAVQELVARDAPVYGINTGFGKLAQTRIATGQLAALQRNLVLSHCAGVGKPLAAPIVRLMLLLKAASLAHGAFGRARRGHRRPARDAGGRRAAGDSGEGLGRRVGRSRAAGAHGGRADRCR